MQVLSAQGMAQHLNLFLCVLGGVYSGREALGSIGSHSAGMCCAGRYNDGFNVYLSGGVLFGTVWGGVIFPPYYLPYFPQPIVTVVVIGPVFAQTVVITNNRPYFSETVFYTETGVRLFNPRARPLTLTAPTCCMYVCCMPGMPGMAWHGMATPPNARNPPSRSLCSCMNLGCQTCSAQKWPFAP